MKDTLHVLFLRPQHMPEVIVIDEIGTEAECIAARTIAQRGVQLVATAHGNELQNVLKNPSLADLVSLVTDCFFPCAAVLQGIYMCPATHHIWCVCSQEHSSHHQQTRAA